MNFALIKELSNANTSIERVSTWLDLFKTTVYWANIDEDYASNLFLLNLADMPSVCEDDDINSFIYYLVSNNLELNMPNAQYPTWILSAIQMQLDYLKSDQS